MSDGGIYFQFRVGRAGTSAANVRYISRGRATNERRENLHLHNYPAYVAGSTYAEMRRNIAEYNRQQEEDELSRPRRGSGRAQTHYRGIISFESEVPTDRAMPLIHEYVEQQFPRARVAIAVHRDTKYTHAHIHVQARDIDGKKLRWSKVEWRNLDARWADIYGREFGLIKTLDHEAKKEEMRMWKAEYARTGGNPSQPAPPRSHKTTIATFKRRAARNHAPVKRIEYTTEQPNKGRIR
jgi:hypothetical protein